MAPALALVSGEKRGRGRPKKAKDAPQLPVALLQVTPELDAIYAQGRLSGAEIARCERARSDWLKQMFDTLSEAHDVLAERGLLRDWCKAAGINYQTLLNKRSARTKQTDNNTLSGGLANSAQQAESGAEYSAENSAVTVEGTATLGAAMTAAETDDSDVAGMVADSGSPTDTTPDSYLFPPPSDDADQTQAIQDQAARDAERDAIAAIEKYVAVLVQNQPTTEFTSCASPVCVSLASNVSALRQ
jgi:hypothetical protein